MTVVDETLRLLIRSGAENYYGEAVTQLQHALQAAECARQADADEETVLANQYVESLNSEVLPRLDASTLQ